MGEDIRILREGKEITVSFYESARKVQREVTLEQKKKPPYLLNIPEEYQSVLGEFAAKFKVGLTEEKNGK